MELGIKYDRIASWWNKEHYESDYGVAQLDKALAMLEFDRTGSNCLDVGCGAGGRLLRRIVQSRLTVTGIDLSGQMIKIASANHPESAFIQGDICTWEPTESFDLILAWDSIFHLPLNMHEPVIRKLCGALNPGGLILYTFGNAIGEHTDTWHGDQFYYSSLGIDRNISLLMESGLTIMRLDLDQYPQKHVCVIAQKRVPAENAEDEPIKSGSVDANRTETKADPKADPKAETKAETKADTYRTGSIQTDTISILQFDPEIPAMLEPGLILHRKSNIPQRFVICFFQDVIDGMRERGEITEIMRLKSEMGHNPIYRFTSEALAVITGSSADTDMSEVEVALFHPGVGASLAAGFLEEVIALGGERFIACGGAGILDPEHHLGKLLVPVSAVRDEGTSYHYMEPGRDAEPTPMALEAVTETLNESGVPFELTRTWTTDAIYRETRGKVAMRREEGCGTVEMEAAAMFAVARFRNVEFAQILYAGDDLSGDFWDSRNWHKREDIREGLVKLAVKACRRL